MTFQRKLDGTGYTVDISKEELALLERATESASNSAKSTAIDMKDYPDTVAVLTEDSEDYAALNKQLVEIRETY